MASTSTLWYLKDLPLYRDVKPYVLNIPLARIPNGQRTNQECYPESSVKLNDIRLSTRTFNLDDMASRSLLKFRYFSTVRRRHSSFPAEPRGSELAETDQPVQGAHCDYTPLEAFKSLEKVVGKEKAAKVWTQRRVQIIQAWRPLRGPVIDWPLAVCDVNSVDGKTELIATDNVWSYAVFETYNVLFSSKHAWYYIANQNENETSLFKGFDNAEMFQLFVPMRLFS
ncbi:methyltransferase like protein [Fusarium circinatum]|uniref:Methyltransferase like protein n=1 Tax=Fusarium circinatum TaxID=48490 RepID=A0A8H5X7T0_FUSCI|nr:methyltransferase like protein [Fusarium circinatum]